MLRIVIGLCCFACLAVAAPTVHLLQPSTDRYEDNTELPLIIEPVAVTMQPLVETSYVDPVKYHQPIAAANHQPVQQQLPYYPPKYMSLPGYQQQPSYGYQQQPSYGYQQQPSYGYQWQWPHSALPQQPIIQPPNTNVLPCSQAQHVGGYQQHGY